MLCANSILKTQNYLYFAAIGFVQIGVWGGTPQKHLSPDELPKAARRGKIRFSQNLLPLVTIQK
jgi:hypothetical protein